MKQTKKFCLPLLLAMLLTSAVSCGSAGETPVESKDTAASSDTAAETVQEIPVKLPDKQYGGYEFSVLAGKNAGNLDTSEEVAAASQNGSALNDALFLRNAAVEDRLGVKIVKRESGAVQDDLRKAVLADEAAYDAVLDLISNQITPITSGYLTEISDLPWIDVEKPWWNSAVIHDTAIANREYLLFGDLSISDKNSTWALVFNKRMYGEFDLTEPYQMVRDGKWTVDVLESHCKNITADLNGDGELGKEDRWGMLSSNTAGIGFITSCGIKTVEEQKDGSLSFILDSESNINAFSRIYRFFANKDLQLRAENIKGSSDIWGDIVNIFKEGRALYRITILGDVNTMRDMEDDFGILPLPKLDENQKEYYTTYQAWSGKCYAVPSNVSDAERCSAVLEAMAYSSTDTLRAAYYDVTLQRKVARDNESSGMLDIIFNAMTTDIGLAFEFSDMRMFLVGILKNDTDTITSAVTAKKSAVTDALQKAYDGILSLE